MGRLDIRSPLTVAGTAQFEACAFRCVPVQPFRAPVRLKRDSNEVSAESFLNHFDEVKNGVRTHMRVPNGVLIFDYGNENSSMDRKGEAVR